MYVYWKIKTILYKTLILKSNFGPDKRQKLNRIKLNEEKENKSE
jgi:hypothetical protein